MSNQPGWFPDPYGRYQQRYHDGTRWTDQVANGTEQLVDPMGTTLAIPFVTPSSATPTGPSDDPAPGTGPAQRLASSTTVAGAVAVAPAGSTSGGGPVRGFLDGLGPDARQRPLPDVTIALAGIGGAVAATGLLLLAADITSLNSIKDVRLKLAALSIVVLAAVYAVRLLVKGQRELRSAAVGAGAVGIFGLAAAIAFTSNSQTLSLLLLAALYLAAWIAPGLRGRPLMLGLGALALVGTVSSLAGDNRVNVGFNVGTGGSTTGQSIAFLLAGAALLALVLLLDREGYHGVATSVLVAGLIATVVGAVQVVGNLDSAGGSFVLALVGIVVCIVGTQGARRASVWLGALIASVGVVAFVVAVVEPGSVSATSGAFIGAAVVLIGGPLAFELIRANRVAQSAAGPTPTASPSNLPPPPPPAG